MGATLADERSLDRVQAGAAIAMMRAAIIRLKRPRTNFGGATPTFSDTGMWPFR